MARGGLDLTVSAKDAKALAAGDLTPGRVTAISAGPMGALAATLYARLTATMVTYS